MATPDSKLTVRTIGELKLLNGNTGECVTVLGYLKPGDGGGGTFCWDATSTAPEDKGLVFEGVPGPKPGRWKRNFAGNLDVRWFGAQGDYDPGHPTQGNDDYDALLAVAEAMSARGGGTLVFPPGVYRIQPFKIFKTSCTPGVPGMNGIQDIVFKNCVGLHIIGYGATINVNGDFFRPDDPSQARQTQTSAISVRTDYYSSVCAVVPLFFQGCKDVVVEGLELNGNVNQTSRALPVTQGGNGIVFGGGSSSYKLLNLYIHNFATDGLYLGMSSLPDAAGKLHTPDQTASLQNVKSAFNGRNALSIISLKGGTFDFCEFAESGHSEGSYGFDPPGAGVDIEPEDPVAVAETGNLTFTSCRFLNNSGTGVASTAGNVKFIRCVIWGTEGYSVFLGNETPNIRFEGCDIFGCCAVHYPHATQMAVFMNCHFEDKDYPSSGKAFRQDPPYGACLVTNVGNVWLDSCLVVANRTRGVELPLPKGCQHHLFNTTIIHKFAGLPNATQDPAHHHQSQIAGAVCSNLRFEEQIEPLKPLPPASPQQSVWYISAGSIQVVDPLYVDGPYIRWGSVLVKTPQVVT